MKEYSLVGAIFATCLLFWIVSPLVALWLASRLSEDEFTIVFAAGGIFCPLLFAAFGFLLARLNGAYVRTAAVRRPPLRVLETSLTVSVLAAAIALAVFFLFFAHNPNPGQPGM